MSDAPLLDAAAIAALLPHRYPFLLVDRIVTIEERRIVGIKNVAADEPYLTAAAGQAPVLPPLVMLEAIAQVGAILLRARPEYRDRLVFFLGIDRVRFRGVAHAGDTVELEAVVRQFRGVTGRFAGLARIGSRVVAQGTMSFAIGPAHQSSAAASAREPT